MNKEETSIHTAPGTGLKKTNGRKPAEEVARYDARVQSARRPSRAEVEAQLESTSASITSRLGALQREVTDTGASVKKAVTENAWLGLGAALVGGLAVGFLLTRPRRSKKQKDVPDDPGQIAALLTRSVASSLSEGKDPTPDVAELLDRISRPDQVATASSSGGLMRSLVLTLANAGVRYALSRAGESAGSGADGGTESGSTPA